MVTVHRSRSRRSERGAAVFIVMMVITLLTAIGVFAARSASLVDAATGYERQAIQAQYLSEYGGRVAAYEFAHPLKANAYNRKLREIHPTKSKELCPSNAQYADDFVGTPPPCLKYTTADMDEFIKANAGEGTVLDGQTEDAAGSLGPPMGAGVSQTLEGSILVEVLDSYQTLETAPGSDRGNTVRSPMAIQFTLTSWSQIRSVAADKQDTENPWCNESASNSAASVQRTRAYVTAPLVNR